MSLDSVHILENVVQRKTLYLHILCSVQLSLLVNLGTTRLLVNLGTTLFSNAIAKTCARSAKLAALTRCSAFFLAATSNSVHLW